MMNRRGRQSVNVGRPPTSGVVYHIEKWKYVKADKAEKVCIKHSPPTYPKRSQVRENGQKGNE